MTLFQKIFLWDKQQALIQIISLYEKKRWWIVNYIYFANLIKSGILSKKNIDTKYENALKNGDFLLPDGIAIKKYYKKYFGKNLHNLNGTDFLPYFLDHISSEYNLFLYWAKQEIIKKAVKNIPYKVEYFQDGYSEFDWGQLEKTVKTTNNKINILLVWLGSPKQEIWIEKNLENIKKYHLLVFSQWWTFDFWSWSDKRAPKWVQNIHLEWLWRVILNPKKNFKKVWYSFGLFWYLIKRRK